MPTASLVATALIAPAICAMSTSLEGRSPMALISDWDRSWPSKRPPLTSDFFVSFWKDCTAFTAPPTSPLTRTKALVPVSRESRFDQALLPSMARRIKVFLVTLHTPLLDCRRVRRSVISLMERPLKSRTSAISASPRSPLSSSTICCLFSSVRPIGLERIGGTSRERGPNKPSLWDSPGGDRLRPCFEAAACSAPDRPSVREVRGS